MKIKVTKTMVNTLNKYCKNKPFRFMYIELSPDNYKSIVDYNLFDNEIDYNADKGVFKAIKCIYNGELYAMPQYLTTVNLNRYFFIGDTLDSYMNRVVEDMEV